MTIPTRPETNILGHYNKRSTNALGALIGQHKSETGRERLRDLRGRTRTNGHCLDRLHNRIGQLVLIYRRRTSNRTVRGLIRGLSRDRLGRVRGLCHKGVTGGLKLHARLACKRGAGTTRSRDSFYI